MMSNNILNCKQTFRCASLIIACVSLTCVMALSSDRIINYFRYMSQQSTDSDLLKVLNDKAYLDDPDFMRLREILASWPESKVIVSPDVNLYDNIRDVVRGFDLKHIEEIFFPSIIRFRLYDKHYLDISDIPLLHVEHYGISNLEFGMYDSSARAQLQAYLDTRRTFDFLNADVWINKEGFPDSILISRRNHRVLVYHNVFLYMTIPRRQGGVVLDEDAEYARSLLRKLYLKLTELPHVDYTPRSPLAEFVNKSKDTEAATRGRIHLSVPDEYAEYNMRVWAYPSDAGLSPEIVITDGKVDISIDLPVSIPAVYVHVNANNKTGRFLEEYLEIDVSDWMQTEPETQ